MKYVSYIQVVKINYLNLYIKMIFWCALYEYDPLYLRNNIVIQPSF